MTANEASERYPDSYIIIRLDSMSLSDHIGTVLYVGDDQDEIFSVLMALEDYSLCGVVEGQTHRRSLGGVVVGA
jgi:hypothetical protein